MAYSAPSMNAASSGNAAFQSSAADATDGITPKASAAASCDSVLVRNSTRDVAPGMLSDSAAMPQQFVYWIVP